MKKKKTGNKEESGLFNDVVWGVQHDAFDDRLGHSLMRVWSVGKINQRTAGMLRDRVRKLKAKDEFGELTPFRKPQLGEGEIPLGRAFGGVFKAIIFIVMQWLNAGLLILGNTGASKTNLTKLLILHLANYLDGLWCSDMYKKEIRGLRPLFHRVGKDFIIARPHQLKVNLLQADGDPRGHLPMMLGILQRILDLPSRAMVILRGVCHWLYEQFGIYRGTVDCWPTLFDAYEHIKKSEGLNAAAKEALLDRLGSFLISLSPKVGAYRLAWKPSDLSKRFIDFEFSTAGEAVKSVVLNYFLFSVLRSRVASGKVNQAMSFMCFFEDCQRFFSSRTEGGEITPAEEIAGLIRGTGTGLAFTAQTMSGLPHGLIPNLGTKVMCRLGSHADYQSLGTDMGMNAEQIKWAKLNLRPGVSIWSLAEGWRLPFPVLTPKLNIPSVVSDADAIASMKALDSLRSVPAPEFANWQPHYVVTVSDTASSSANHSLSDAELRFLDAVVSEPGKGSSFYSRKTGISGKRAAAIRAKLVEAGYVREHKVATSQRGRTSIVLEPTDEATEAIADAVK